MALFTVCGINLLLTLALKTVILPAKTVKISNPCRLRHDIAIGDAALLSNLLVDYSFFNGLFQIDCWSSNRKRVNMNQELT